MDIFQTKLDKIIGDIEGVNTYIDDIRILIEDGFTKHTDQLRFIFTGLCRSGMKVNIPKCSLGLK